MSKGVQEVSAEYRLAQRVDDCPVRYRKTEVGIIPENWNVRKAKDIFIKIQDGTHFSPKLGGSDYLYVTSKNIRPGRLDLSAVEYIDDKAHKSIYARCDVSKGDILLTKDGANTGNAAINTLEEEFSLLSSVAFLRVNAITDSAAYYLQQILSPNFQKNIQVAMSGNAITRLTLDKINNLLFVVPPKKEQTAIANALSDVDALIASLERLITKKRAIKTAAMQQLLTGKKRLPPFDKTHTGYKQTELGEIPEDWEVTNIGEFAPLQRGFDLPNRDRVNGVYPVVYSNGIVNFHNQFQVKGPGVVTGRSGTLGKVHYVEEDFWPHNTALWVTKFNNANPKFVYYLYLKIGFSRFASGSGVPTLNRNDAHSYKIAVPSLEEEQAAIASVISDMDKELDALEQRLTKTQQLKQGMMQELLTGKTRLV